MENKRTKTDGDVDEIENGVVSDGKEQEKLNGDLEKEKQLENQEKEKEFENEDQEKERLDKKVEDDAGKILEGVQKDVEEEIDEETRHAKNIE